MLNDWFKSIYIRNFYPCLIFLTEAVIHRRENILLGQKNHLLNKTMFVVGFL